MSLRKACQRLVSEGRAVQIPGTMTIKVLNLQDPETAEKWRRLNEDYGRKFDGLREERRRREREAEIRQHREYGHFVFNC